MIEHWKRKVLPAAGLAAIILVLLIILLPRLGSRQDKEPGNTVPDSQGDRTPNTPAQDTVSGDTGDANNPSDNSRIATDDTPTGYTITGIVVDEKDQPVRDADVIIVTEKYHAMYDQKATAALKSGEDGRFAANDLPRTDIFVTASKDGYLAYLLEGASYYGCKQYTCVPYDETSESGEVRLVLRPGAIISGKVVDQDGAPVPDAKVSFHRQRISDSPGWITSVMTDENGLFCCNTLAIGTYGLSASKEGYGLIHGGYNTHTGEKNVLLTIGKRITVSGTVIFADTKLPVMDATVSYGKKTDENGRFSFETSPTSRIHISASWMGMRSRSMLSVDPSKDDLSNVIIELLPSSSLSGKIIDVDTGELVPEALVSVGGTTATVECKDGVFDIKDVSPGRIWLGINSREYCLAEEMAGSGGQITIDLEEGEHRKDYVLKVKRLFPCKISGIVVDIAGKPIQGATISLMSGSYQTYGPDITPTDEEGHFTIDGFSRKEVDALFLKHDEYSPKYFPLERLGEHLVTGNLRIVMVSGGSIGGTVRNSNGTPCTSVEIQLSYSNTGSLKLYIHNLMTVYTDSDGHYKFPHVGPGSYSATATFGKIRKRSDTITIKASEIITGVDIVVDLTGRISGRITDTGGKPVEGLDVRIYNSLHGNELARQVTGPDGRYAFVDIEEGKSYALRVMRNAPQGTVKLAATEKEIMASADDVDFQVEMKELGSLLIRVLRAKDKTPVKDYQVSLSSKESYGSLFYDKQVVSDDGELLCEDIWPGQYSISLKTTESSNHALAQATVIEKETAEVEILLEEEAVLKYHVVAEADGLPVKDFHLDMYPRDKKSYPIYNKHILSDDGTFEITLTPDQYSIRIEAEGFSHHEAMSVTLDPGAHEEITVKMLEGLTVKGKVVDESGRGIKDATVKVYHVYNRIPNPEIKTNASGSFLIENLPSTNYCRFDVTHPEYPAVSCPDMETTKKIEAGEEITIVMKTGGVIYGTFTDIDGKRKEGIGIGLYAGGNSGWSKSTTTNSKGEFRFEMVPPGKAFPTTGHRKCILPSFELESGEEKEVDIDLSEGGSLSGTVTFPERPEGSEFQVHICRTKSKDGSSAGEWSSALVDKEGRYKFESLPAGEYRFYMQGQGPTPDGKTKSYKIDLDTTSYTIDVPEGHETENDIKVRKLE